jgi:F-type H+-transporting ATPase subunit b
MMDELLRQLGDLLLGSVPTMIIFLILVLAYRFILHGPLLKVLAERREMTAGAKERAHAAIAAAEAKSQEYEAKLRAARAEIFKAREQRMQQWNAQREKAIESARLAAHERIQAARQSIEAEADLARQRVESLADQLAGQILQAILPAGAEGVR